MRINNKNKWGQVFLGFIFAFIALVLLTVGITRIWAWFNLNLAGRGWNYQQTRRDAARGVNYNELEKATQRPFFLDDEWLFKGKSSQAPMPSIVLENVSAMQGLNIDDCCKNCCNGAPHVVGCGCIPTVAKQYTLKELQDLYVSDTVANGSIPCDGFGGVSGDSQKFIPPGAHVYSCDKNNVPNITYDADFIPPGITPLDTSTPLLGTITIGKNFGDKEVKPLDKIDVQNPNNPAFIPLGLGVLAIDPLCTVTDPKTGQPVLDTDNNVKTRNCPGRQRCTCRVGVARQVAALRAQALMQRQSAADLEKQVQSLRSKASDCDEPWSPCWWFSGFGKMADELYTAASKMEMQVKDMYFDTDAIDGGLGQNNLNAYLGIGTNPPNAKTSKADYDAYMTAHPGYATGASRGYIGELNTCCEQAQLSAAKDAGKDYDTIIADSQQAIDDCLIAVRMNIGDSCKRYVASNIDAIGKYQTPGDMSNTDQPGKGTDLAQINEKEKELTYEAQWVHDLAYACFEGAAEFCAIKVALENGRQDLVKSWNSTYKFKDPQHNMLTDGTFTLMKDYQSFDANGNPTNKMWFSMEVTLVKSYNYNYAQTDQFTGKTTLAVPTLIYNYSENGHAVGCPLTDDQKGFVGAAAASFGITPSTVTPVTPPIIIDLCAPVKSESACKASGSQCVWNGTSCSMVPTTPPDPLANLPDLGQQYMRCIKDTSTRCTTPVLPKSNVYWFTMGTPGAQSSVTDDLKALGGLDAAGDYDGLNPYNGTRWATDPSYTSGGTSNPVYHPEFDAYDSSGSVVGYYTRQDNTYHDGAGSSLNRHGFDSNKMVVTNTVMSADQSGYTTSNSSVTLGPLTVFDKASIYGDDQNSGYLNQWHGFVDNLPKIYDFNTAKYSAPCDNSNTGTSSADLAAQHAALAACEDRALDLSLGDEVTTLESVKQQIIAMAPTLINCCSPTLAHPPIPDYCSLCAAIDPVTGKPAGEATTDACKLSIPQKKIRCVNEKINDAYKQLQGLVNLGRAPVQGVDPCLQYTPDSCASVKNCAVAADGKCRTIPGACTGN